MGSMTKFKLPCTDVDDLRLHAMQIEYKIDQQRQEIIKLKEKINEQARSILFYQNLSLKNPK